MDKDEARLILACFRPDGADAASADFAEALRLAAEDRELGAWLARERAFDARFTDALDRLPLPQGLREELLANLASAREGIDTEDGLDASMIGALGSIHVPDSLKGEILAAMEQSRVASMRPLAAGRNPRRWRLAVPLAAAAGLAFALWLEQRSPSAPPTLVADASPHPGTTVPVDHVIHDTLATLRVPGGPSLDIRNSDQKVLFDFVRRSDRPCPEGALTEKIRKLHGVGCRNILIDGKPGAIICFERGPHRGVHLVVFRREDVEGILPTRSGAEVTKHGEWSVIEWEDDDKAMFLIGEPACGNLRELLF